MARREKARTVRFLPLYLAMERFLALHFAGPAIAWEEWSRAALRGGLSPRGETAWGGGTVTGLGRPHTAGFGSLLRRDVLDGHRRQFRASYGRATSR